MNRDVRILAALDIGTNSSLFLLAEVGADGKIVPRRHEVRTNDLGRGLNEQGELSSPTIELNLRLMREFQQTARQHGAQEIRIAGTEALRRAANSATLIDRARRELGLEIKIISGAEEAALTYRGVLSGWDKQNQRLAVIDVGGGSTEIILGEGPQVLEVASLPLGAVSLDRQFIRHDPAAPEEISAIRTHIEASLADLPCNRMQRDIPLIICGGTASALASADLGLATYQPEKIAGHSMTRPQIDRFVQQFSSLKLDDRRAIPGIGRRRAEIILPGALIIAQILQTLGREEYSTSERGLRYGLLLS